jgi:hypothetical protein
MKGQGRNCGRRAHPSGASRSSRWHLVVALGVAGALSAAAIVTGGPDLVQARTDASSDCVTVPLGSQGRAICTYLDAGSVDLADLIDAVDGNENSSGIWVQAWGGAGANAPDDTNRGGDDGGAGGAGGYAQSYYASLSHYETALDTETPTVYPYYGGNGGARAGVVLSAGGGGASTLVASRDVTEGSGPDYGPCIAADPNALDQDGTPTPVDFHSANGALCDQSVVVLAGGGGGGGGTSGVSHAGKSGGAGGVAIASSSTTVGEGSDGDSQYPKRAGVGGFDGAGGHNHKFDNGDGGDGIGGSGGPYGSNDNAGDTAGSFLGPIFVGGETNGQGGRGYAAGANYGGGGGGGFGGGGGGGGAGTSGSAGGSGGGGGGSYAFKGDPVPEFPLRSGPPATGAPSADQGAVRIVVDDVGQPTLPPPPCIITLHGTGAAETLRGTTGGDDIYAHEGNDSIVAGPGDDCARGGAGGDTICGGRGDDLLIGDGGNGGAGGAGGNGGAGGTGGNGGDSDTVVGGRGADKVVGQGGHDTLRGGRGPDRIDAEGGHHRARGGLGADRIHARDGKRDTVRCGPGHDVVWADARDLVAPSCERVHD